MGFQLYASRYISRLFDRFVIDLREAAKASDPLDPIHVVTQTEGMNVWLSTKIAESTGISANIRFLTPQSLLEKMHEAWVAPARETLSSKSLAWVLYRMMGEQDFMNQPGHASVVNYIKDDNLKRLGLAQKLVDLFDQYQIYRHGMVEKWNRPPAGEMDFQEYLWRRMKSELGDDISDKTVLRSGLLGAIEGISEESKSESLGTFGRIHFFGLSVFTPYHMDIIESLSRISTIRFYMLNPAASDYWYEDLPDDVAERWRELRPDSHPITGNNLLTGWGKIIKDTFRMFIERNGLVNQYVSLDDQDREMYHGEGTPEPDSKLQLLQRQIMYNEVGKDKVFHAGLVADDSIQVHACYTQAREVEALYNYLTGLFEKDKTLTGRHVLVSCDIDLYAPYIRAVFDTGPVKLRYTISDAAYAQGDNPIRALASILSLDSSDFNAEEVLRLLDFTCIRNKFGITDVSLVREIVREAMFRFGLEGREEDDSRLFGLPLAIQRIAYGLGMRIDGVYRDFFPLDLVEGQESEQAIRFCIFAEALKDSINRRNAEKSLVEWVEYTEGIMDGFLFEPETEDEDQILFQELLNRELGHFNSAGGRVGEAVPYRLFSTSLKEAITQERRMRRFHSQGITFCSHVPMRSVPFRVVCMMGMDHDKFPRQDAPMSFSHIDGKQIGDRNLRSNDKHLFLESLMSAESHFYLSYIGTHVKENSHIPPSVLVEELVNHLVDRSEDPEAMRSALVFRHPLHSFSHRYNREGSQLTSYLIDSRKQEIPLKDDPVEEDSIHTVNLHEFCGFFSDPFKFHYNKGLKVYFEEVDELLPVSEVFDMSDNLDRFIMKKDIITGQLNEQNVRERVLSGDLPPGNVGKVIFESVSGDVLPIKQTYVDLVSGVDGTNDRDVSIPIGDGRHLTGRVTGLFNDRFVEASPGSSNLLKKLIPFSIKYLAMRASGMEVVGYFLAKDEKTPACHLIRMKPLHSGEALVKISGLMDLFNDHRGRIMPFHPELLEGLKGVPANLDDEEAVGVFKEKLLDKIEAKFEEKDGSYGKERLSMKYVNDAYDRGLFEDEGFVDRLVQNSVRIYNELIPSVFQP
jgi:exodeoxyribonuclease V gamma subunit